VYAGTLPGRKTAENAGKTAENGRGGADDSAALNSPAPLAQKKRDRPEDFSGGGAGV
jgi:hypothetical protein